jgi:hypothetical protein
MMMMMMMMMMMIETVCTTYEKLKMDDQTPKKDITSANSKQLEYLWKSNEQLRGDIIKVNFIYTYGD